MDPDLNPYAAPSTGGDRVPPSPGVLGGRLRLTAYGLRLAAGGAVVTLFAWLAAIIANIIGPEGGFFSVTSAIVAAIGLATANLGPFLCLSVPSGFGLRSFAFATVLVQLSGVVVFAFSFAATGIFVTFALLVVAVLAGSLFLMFIYRLSQLLARPDLIRRTRRVSLFGGAVVFGFVPLMSLDNAWSVNVAFMIWVGYLAAVGLTLISYAMLANAVANAIGHKIGD